MNVKRFIQEKSWYCGPACVKMVAHYTNGYSQTQATYASRLGTTSSNGSSSIQIAEQLRFSANSGYVRTSSANADQMFAKFVYSNNLDMPLVLSIQSNYHTGFPYKTYGHFVVGNGANMTTNQVFVTDPYDKGKAAWVSKSAAWNVNKLNDGLIVY